MDREVKENYIKAGKIAAEVLKEAKKFIVPNVSILEVVEKTESLIIKKGGSLACPVTLSINEVAAHYTPAKNEKTIIKENDVAKLDIGVHINGYVADTATTVCLDREKEEMNDIIKQALENALSAVKPGLNLGQLGAIIQETVERHGYRVIINLTGHTLGKYDLHEGVNIPNIKMNTKETLKEGTAIAVEPFLTDGAGAIKESDKVQIYKFLANKPARMNEARKILQLSQTIFNKMPFATRWLNINPFLLEQALKQLRMNGALYPYPVLKEIRDGIVVQAEHTTLVLDKPIVTTR